MRSAFVTRAGLIALVAALAACGDDGGNDPSSPAAIARVSADSQTVAVGVAMAQPLVVLVTGGGASPLPNISVTWGILEGGGSLSDTTVVTDASGHARTTYTPGTTPGRGQVVAAVGALQAGFFLTLVAGPVSQLQKFGSDNPAVVVGSTLSLSVKAADAFGNGIPGRVVNWSVDGGTISVTTSTSDAGGVASVTFTTGTARGRYTLTATSEGLAPATFVITAI